MQLSDGWFVCFLFLLVFLQDSSVRLKNTETTGKLHSTSAGKETEEGFKVNVLDITLPSMYPLSMQLLLQKDSSAHSYCSGQQDQ